TIGGDIEINDDHLVDIIKTEQKSVEDKTRREYCNKNKVITLPTLKKGYGCYQKRRDTIMTSARVV
ncbi:hypothetical protein HJC23_011441, partial [Cyclotella cryptica]